MQNPNFIRFSAFAMLASAAALTGTPSAAQGEATGGLDEIIVTARKRAESLQDVPGSLTAFDRRAIDDARLDRIEDFIDLSANVDIRATNNRLVSDIVIRGVATGEVTQEPGFGLYSDGVYIGSNNNVFTQFSDIERVEILRGPQGGLYGRNAVGGSINIVNAKPINEFEALGDLIYGRFGRVEARAMVNAPLVEDVAALRVNFYRIDQDDGELKNVTLDEELDREESTGIRVKGRLTPTEAITLDLSFEWVDEEGGGRQFVDEAAGQTKSTLMFNTPNERRLETTQYTAELNWDIGPGTFTTIASYREEETGTRNDFDGGIAESLEFMQDVESEAVFIETRYLYDDEGPFTLLAGLNYYRNETDLGLTIDINFAPFFGPGFEKVQTLNNNSQTVKSIAGFVELEWDITDRFTAFGHVRYTRDKKDLMAEQAIPAIALFFPGPPFQQMSNDSEVFDKLSPGGGVRFAATDNINLYAKIVTGFRAGGFNVQVSDISLAPFDEETSINYEIGAKTEWLDNRLRLNLAAFRLDQNDLIVQVLDPNPFFAAFGLTFNQNVGDSKTYGVEVDGAASITDGFDILFGVGWTDIELDNFTNAFGMDFSGNRSPGSAKWNFNLGATYRQPILDTVDLFANATFSVSRGGFQDVENLISLADREILNLKGGFEGEHWRLLGYVDNATDDDFIISTTLAGDAVVRAQGRTFGVQGTVMW